MPELESLIEQKLIEQLIYGDSQWTYRPDLKTEADLWNNFKYILEQNNKDRLDGEPLSDSEFEQVKNQLQFSTFYKAGEWLVGENGKVMVHVQRDTKKLHLVVMNHEHIAGGSSVYEVINQYSALKDDDDAASRDRRFDVTLMINGLPMIHIELKNRQHSYMEAFNQIKKYIGEGQFRGIFSAVQMFVISNGVDTKYFSAASDTELKKEFISGWVDRNNQPVSDYIDFAKNVLKIPQAHEMIARYTVLDNEAKRLILLRPYQIHAIEAIREASRTGKSGFVWHTTGSGKTLTSYKATRNLLMDIPALDKAIFLIDRKDLDEQTNTSFSSYSQNDSIDVDNTDNVTDLKNKLKSSDRQMIVTTIQKMQILISKRLKEGTAEYNRLRGLKIAFVVDECHRSVSPATKRIIERFFGKSLWFGFTGTPRFPENPYPLMGDLPRTTEELYGACLHKYTIQNAIHDNAVLGFQVEHDGPKDVTDETDSSRYENETHMLKVLEVILNKSYHKLGFQNGKGKTFEGLLTTSSISLAQKYYELLTRVKNGETPLKIDERIKQVLPDFPKFAITYSVTENEDGSQVNQEKMKQSLDDYNAMLDDYGITEQEYIDYAGHYLNIKSEIGPDPGPDPVNPPVEPEIDSDYELMAYSNTRIDYEYIINLIQNIVNPEEDGDITPEEKQKKIDEAKQYVEDLRKDNPKVADIMSHLINEIELDESRFKGKSILNIVDNMKHECIEQVVSNFCLLWHADKDDVMYAATHYRNGIIPNESAIKASINYPEYKNTVEHALPKFKYYAKFFAELRSTLDDEIKPLV